MSKKSPTYRNLPEDPCLTEAQLYGYIDGKLTPQEQHVVEKHVLDCEMCSDALDGLALVKNREKAAFVPPVADQKPAAEKETKPNEEKGGRIIPLFGARGRYAAAAAIILLLGFAWFLRDNFLSADKEKSLSQNMDSVSASAPFDASGAKADSMMADSREDKKPQYETPAESADKDAAPPSPSALKNSETNNGPVAASENQNFETPKAAASKTMDGDMENEKLSDEKQQAALEQDIVTAAKTDQKEEAPANPTWYKDNADGQKPDKNYLAEDDRKTSTLFNSKQETSKKKSRLNLDTQFKKERAYGFSAPRADAPSDFLSKANVADSTKATLGTGVANKSQVSGGTYSVTVTDANGCCNGTSAPVVQNSAPATSGSATVSPGASGGATYNWSGADFSSTNVQPYSSNTIPSVVAADSIKLRNELETESYNRTSPVADKQSPDAVQYKRGSDLLKANNDQAAIVAFDAILLNPKSPYFEDAQWYKAVALVKLNKREEAKALLNAIVKKGGKYKALAESQLKQF